MKNAFLKRFLSVFVLSATLCLLPSLTLARPPVHTPASVTASSSQILGANSGRMFLSCQNFSDTAEYCTVDGTTATTSTGYLLGANGGAVWFDVEPTVPKGAVKCIHGSSGDKAIVCTEETQ